MPRSHRLPRWARTAAALSSASTVLAVLAVLAPAASAAPATTALTTPARTVSGTVTARNGLAVRKVFNTSGPVPSDAPINYYLSYGDQRTVYCWMNGPPNSGPYGTTDAWDAIYFSEGHVGSSPTRGSTPAATSATNSTTADPANGHHDRRHPRPASPLHGGSHAVAQVATHTTTGDHRGHVHRRLPDCIPDPSGGQCHPTSTPSTFRSDTAVATQVSKPPPIGRDSDNQPYQRAREVILPVLSLTGAWFITSAPDDGFAADA